MCGFLAPQPALSYDRKASRPVLCAVIDAQNFNGLLALVDAVDGDIRQGREQNFSGAFFSSGTAPDTATASMNGLCHRASAWRAGNNAGDAL